MRCFVSVYVCMSEGGVITISLFIDIMSFQNIYNIYLTLVYCTKYILKPVVSSLSLKVTRLLN